jgi:hypothetical protein
VDYRQLARTIAAGRIAAGAALVLLPGTAAGRWIGPVSRDGGAKVMIRAMGARDLALGAGTMHALANGEPARTWVLAGAASDLADAVATVLAVRAIGVRRALPLLAVAVTAGAASYVAADHLD